jgi:K+-transporting ATPase KdpF subunit
MIKKENYMKTKVTSSFLLFAAVLPHSAAAASNDSISYLIGGIIALLIMGYLVYTLMRPEKF